MADREDWERRWREGQTPWDLKGVTPALIHWRGRDSLKGRAVLVPGCGRGHDAHYLAKWGARVTAVDYSLEALAEAKRGYPRSRILWLAEDVTTLPFDQEFDRVWEYTCFCALEPPTRTAYLQAVYRALKSGGYYWGLVFAKVPNEEGPPFAIEPEAFHALLSQWFTIVEFEPESPRSVAARRGNEIWFCVTKKRGDH